jgi:hypothetical protein
VCILQNDYFLQCFRVCILRNDDTWNVGEFELSHGAQTLVSAQHNVFAFVFEDTQRENAQQIVFGNPLFQLFEFVFGDRTRIRRNVWYLSGVVDKMSRRDFDYLRKFDVHEREIWRKDSNHFEYKQIFLIIFYKKNAGVDHRTFRFN